MSVSRRRFLRAGLAAAAGLVAGRAWAAAPLRKAPPSSGYGPLVPDPEGLLDLPAGFDYRLISSRIAGRPGATLAGDRMTNGDPLPAGFDHMSAFPGLAGMTVLIRNHELLPADAPMVDPRRLRPYDRLGAAGTTTLWVDGDARVVRSFASLSGTCRSCAGGPTPWGTYLSAEECVFMPGPPDPVSHDLRPDVAERHGYVFEVDPRAEGLVDPSPIRAMGRFYHEGAAADPATGWIYLTEDRADGLLYRFRPGVLRGGRVRPATLRPGDLARGGSLEALRLVERPGASTVNHPGDAPRFVPGERHRVDWVPIAEPDPEVDQERDAGDPEPDPLKRRPRTASGSTRAQGAALGAARFSRGEGIVYQGRAIRFCCTDGGAARAGQVWRLDPRTDTLALDFESGDPEGLRAPDNIAAAPNGDLILCEDGPGRDRVVALTPRGHLYNVARNAFNDSEFAGACFSPDGATLFVNVREPGMTYAIRGPWARRPAGG